MYLHVNSLHPCEQWSHLLTCLYLIFERYFPYFDNRQLQITYMSKSCTCSRTYLFWWNLLYWTLTLERYRCNCQKFEIRGHPWFDYHRSAVFAQKQWRLPCSPCPCCWSKSLSIALPIWSQYVFLPCKNVVHAALEHMKLKQSAVNI